MHDDPTLAPTLASESQPGTHESQPLRRGVSTGRFVVLDELGRGAMGTVYAAFDVKLERQVALKLLHRSDRGLDSLLSEAQALARINHPNVVTVHDVGTHEDQLFLAMELVAGQPLRTWQEHPDRTWQDIVEVYRKAARGLMAVHDADLVHGDFKPDNVMAADDGRVLVMDFGIARPLWSTVSESGEVDPADERTVVMSRIRGTPAYMSPEQFSLENITPASDQFGFCVALHEALWGERPFDGATLAELADAITSGARRPRGERRSVPAWVTAIVERGLLRDPGARFSSMRALDEAFDAALIRRQRRVTVGGLTVLSVGIGVALLVPAQAETECDIAARELSARVTDSKELLRAHFESFDHPDAPAVWGHIERGLDGFVSSWTASNAAQCGAAAESQPELARARRTCLDRQRDTVTSILTVLDESKADLIRVGGVVAAVPHPSVCSTLTAEDEPPRRHVGAELEAQRTFSKGRAQYLLGQREAGMNSVNEAIVALRGTEAHELLADALLWRSAKRRFRGEFEAAESDSKEGLAHAAQSESSRAVVRAWLNRIDLVLQSDPTGAKRIEAYFEAAENALLVAGTPKDLRSSYLEQRSAWFDDSGDPTTAMTLIDEALALARESDRPVRSIAQLLNVRGTIHTSLGDRAQAREDFATSAKLRAEAYGPLAPGLSTAHSNLGAMCFMLGDYPCAQVSFTKVATILDASGDTNSASRANLEAMLAEIAFWEDRIEESEAHIRRSLAIVEERELHDQPFALNARKTLLRILAKTERWEEGEALAQLQLQANERRFGGTAREPTGLRSIADFYNAKGDYERALQYAQQARALDQTFLPVDNPELGAAWNTEAGYLIDLGRLDEATAALKLARSTVFSTPGGSQLNRSSVRFNEVLLRDARGEHDEAVADARALLRDMGRDTPELAGARTIIETWLAERTAGTKNAPDAEAAGGHHTAATSGAKPEPRDSGG